MAQQAERARLLCALIDAQKAKPEHFEAGRAAAQAISLSLQRREDLSVAEVRFSGSIARGSSLNSSDFDLVVFLNNVEPPFSSRIVDTIQKAVRQARVPGGMIYYRGKNNKLVKASAQIGEFDLKFDISIASAIVSRVDDGQTEVTRAALEMEEGGEASLREISPVFAEATMLFFRDVTSPMLEAIRVAKYWNNKVNLHGVKIHGISLIVELVTLEANHPSEGTDLEARFVKFLRAMQHLAEQEVTVTAYGPDRLCSWFSRPTPRILAFANPDDNLGEQFQSGEPAHSALAHYKKAATETLEKIEKAWQGLDYYQNPANWF
ncbi:uncharacterized protein LOC118439326 [Folsomia candida]|uniref:uncharacterized protein LOC118439326 n=1 Tax=Folsomia candida TaxID=158441 RepID=UPI0016053037|nr:uncharacterized protein LOC118439326 [Folsomia candida]